MDLLAAMMGQMFSFITARFSLMATKVSRKATRLNLISSKARKGHKPTKSRAPEKQPLNEKSQKLAPLLGRSALI